MKNLIVLGSVLLLICGCTPNMMHRKNCDMTEANCKNPIIEKHPKDNYDLTFVEFTERGNVFSREGMDDVITYIKKQVKENSKGVMLFVYVHGWKHNAKSYPDDGEYLNDVNHFRNSLKVISENKFLDKKVIGLYVGWRGESYSLQPLKTLTYWSRKATAQQVGNGGVTELLLRLEKVTNSDYGKNIYIVAGHSFGSVVVLSALKDIFIERMIHTEEAKYCGFDKVKEGAYINACNKVKNEKGRKESGCIRTKGFGNGVFLLNPAVEANELLQIKELATAEKCYASDQPKLLHILSSDSDKATKYAFPAGQLFGVAARYNQNLLDRELNYVAGNRKKSIKLGEYSLDTTAIGHYAPFLTGKSKNECLKSDPCIETYTPCGENGACVPSDDERGKYQNFPYSPHEPVSIIRTDGDFMGDHNDIFNENVIGYLAAAITEEAFNRFKCFPNGYCSRKEDVDFIKYENTGSDGQDVTDNCFDYLEDDSRHAKFSFKKCTKFFREKYYRKFEID